MLGKRAAIVALEPARDVVGLGLGETSGANVVGKLRVDMGVATHEVLALVPDGLVEVVIVGVQVPRHLIVETRHGAIVLDLVGLVERVQVERLAVVALQVKSIRATSGRDLEGWISGQQKWKSEQKKTKTYQDRRRPGNPAASAAW